MFFEGLPGILCTIVFSLLLMAFFILAQMVTDDLKVSFIQAFLS